MRILIFCCFLSFLAGCCGDSDLKLIPALKAWAPYRHHQLVTFYSSPEDSLLFKVYIKNYNQRGTDQVCGGYNIETIETNLIAQADTNVQVKVSLSFEALVGIKALNKTQPGYGFNIQFNSISKQYVSDPYRDQYLKEMQLNGRIYRHVLHAYGNQIAGALFAEIYYAQDIGLIGFKDFTGTWYYLP